MNKHLRRHARIVRRGLARLSWFIYRFTSPVVERLFMASVNPFNLEKAVISLLAGDVFRSTPGAVAMALFKLGYHVVSMLQWKSTLAWRRRRGGS